MTNLNLENIDALTFIETVPSNLEKASLVPQNVLLTGAPGYLATYMLGEYFSMTPANVFCFGRPSKGKTLGDRCMNSIKTYLPGMEMDRDESRIKFVEGDFTKAKLGLTDENYEKLSSEVDTVFHCGAVVNHLYSFSSLVTPNVFGVNEILKFACHRKLKHVHMVSTAVIFYTLGNLGRTIHEDEPLPAQITDLKILKMGYPQTKLAAEKLANSAMAKGIPVSIYRPGHIGWHTKTGISNPVDFMCNLLRLSVSIGLAPMIDIEWDVAPIDYVAKAMVHLSMDRSNANRNYHVNSPYVTSWKEAMGIVGSLVPHLRLVSFHDWIMILLESDLADDPFLIAIKEFFSEQIDGIFVPKNRINGPINIPVIDNQLTRSRLTKIDPCPPLNVEFFKPFVQRVLK